MSEPSPNPATRTEGEAAAPDDRVLTVRLQELGDERAFRLLYDRHTLVLFQILLRTLGGDEVEAEDALQETWLRAVRGLDGFRWQARFRTWLIAIGIRVCRSRFAEMDDLKMETSSDQPGTWDVSIEERIDLERAIALLPPGYRTVLVLHDVHGFKHEEIGAMLEISAGTSKSQLSRARRAVRDVLRGQA